VRAFQCQSDAGAHGVTRPTCDGFNFILIQASNLKLCGPTLFGVLKLRFSWSLKFEVWSLFLCGAWNLPAATNAADEAAVPQLAPPYPEIPPTFWEQYGSFILIAVILMAGVMCLVAVALFLALRKRAAVAVAPEVQARNELKSLQALPDSPTVWSKTSQATRRYFVAAFALPPGEHTTAEFCRYLQAQEKVGADLAAEVTTFLRESDERKFAPNTAPLVGVASRALVLVEKAETRRRAALVKPS
jgi:hypothetical protein